MGFFSPGRAGAAERPASSCQPRSGVRCGTITREAVLLVVRPGLTVVLGRRRFAITAAMPDFSILAGKEKSCDCCGNGS